MHAGHLHGKQTSTWCPCIVLLLSLGLLAVCSEVKGLQDLPGASRDLIQTFPPGHVRTFDIDSLGRASAACETKRYLSIGGCDPHTVANLVPDDTSANIRMLLKDAVKKRLLADRRIGCLLSGGLDSSLTTALLVECMKETGCEYK